MKAALALVAMTAPVFAEPDSAGEPPLSPPGQTIPTPPPGQPATEPRVDPAYSERPDAHESATRAGPDERPGTRRAPNIVVKYHPDRSRENIAKVAIIGGAGLLLCGVGLYFHRYSRDPTHQVKSHRHTGRTLTADRHDTYARAHPSDATPATAYLTCGPHSM